MHVIRIQSKKSETESESKFKINSLEQLVIGRRFLFVDSKFFWRMIFFHKFIRMIVFDGGFFFAVQIIIGIDSRCR